METSFRRWWLVRYMDDRGSRFNAIVITAVLKSAVMVVHVNAPVGGSRIGLNAPTRLPPARPSFETNRLSGQSVSWRISAKLGRDPHWRTKNGARGPFQLPSIA